MSRQARRPGEYYHAIVRGIGRQVLFEVDDDRRYFLSLLKRYGAETGVQLLAYCLMENHVHLLLHDADSRIAVFMKKLGVSYAMYFNSRYDRTGHLFQDRYKSEVITDDSYLLCVYRYILNNPVKAGIALAEEYAWSSYRDYGNQTGLTDTRMLADLIGSKSNLAAFLNQEDERDPIEAESDSRRHDDEWARDVIRRTLNIESGTVLQQYEKQARDEALRCLKQKGLTIRQLERLTGINRGVIQQV